MTIDQSKPQLWGLRGTAVAVGVAAVIAGLGGAAIFAATGSHTSQQAFGHNTPGAPPPGGFGGQNPATPPLHGEFVVSDGGDRYTTTLTQTGTVTQISPTSITVRSADAYTQTYVMPSASDADRSIVLNDDVSIRATRTGQTATITDITARQSPGSPGGPPGPGTHN